MLYPLSYEGGVVFPLVRGYLLVAGERALGRRVRVVADRWVSNGSVSWRASRWVSDRDRPTVVVRRRWVEFVARMSYLCASRCAGRDTHEQDFSSSDRTRTPPLRGRA